MTVKVYAFPTASPAAQQSHKAIAVAVSWYIFAKERANNNLVI